MGYRVTIYTCPICHINVDTRKAFLKDGNILATCPRCGKDYILKHNVKCEETGWLGFAKPCENMATHLLIAGGILMGDVVEFMCLCDEHYFGRSLFTRLFDKLNGFRDAKQ